MSCGIHEHYDAIETEGLTYFDLSFDKLKLLSSNLELPRMETKIRKNYLCLPYDSIANGALPPWLTFFLQWLMTIPLANSQRSRLKLQVQTLIFLSRVFLSTENAYSSFSLLILFINTLLLHGLNPRPSLYNISAKNHLNCLQNLLFESLFLWVFVASVGRGNIFLSAAFIWP